MCLALYSGGMFNTLPKIRIRPGAQNGPGLRIRNEQLSLENEKLKLADLVGEMGVLNRNAQNMRLVGLAERIMRRNDAEPDFEGFVVGFIDINKLKAINDFGGTKAAHDLGDDAILNVASAMAKTFRSWEDSVVRFGGDEFCLFLPMSMNESDILLHPRENTSDRKVQLQELVEEGLDVLESKHTGNWPLELVDGKRPGTVSVGWAFISRDKFMQKFREYNDNPDPKKGDFISTLVKSADEKMYSQKHNMETGGVGES